MKTTMSRNAKSVKAIKTFISVAVAASIMVGQVYAVNMPSNTMTRAEYAKEIIKANGVALTQIPGGSDDITDEDYIYTALQNGLFKGVSFKFEGEITADEIETMNANLNALNLAINPEEAQTPEESIEQPENGSDEVDPYQTEWGAIRKPSSMTPNEDVWSDEEFHQFLLNESEVRKYMMYYLRESGESMPKTGPVYDEESRTFLFRGYTNTVVDGSIMRKYDYLDLDEEVNEKVFNALKVALYHAKEKNVGIYLSNHGDHIKIAFRKNEQKALEQFALWIRHAGLPDQYSVFADCDQFEVGVTDIDHRWDIKWLMGREVYAEHGVDFTWDSWEDVLAVQMKQGYSDQFYTDLFYAMCDALYGDEAEAIYLEIFSQYLYEKVMATQHKEHPVHYATYETKTRYVFTSFSRMTDEYFGISYK